MHYELFYIGIGTGLHGEMSKEAILGMVCQGLAGLGERAADSSDRAAANIYNKPFELVSR